MPPARVTPDMLEACRRGDPEAFDRLVAACRDRVYSLAWHLSGSQSAADDIAQDVFVKLLTRIGQFRREAEFTTWLYRIVANTAIDYQRASRRLVPVEEGEPSAVWQAPQQEERLSRAQTAARVRDALARIRPRFRTPLVLRYVEGLSYQEIARVLRISPGTVASRLSRGQLQLGRALRDLAPDTDR
jgi:RNA polymerase sigma-70 factor (ECF subfamily)